MEKILQFANGRDLHSLYANDENNLDIAQKKLGVKLVARGDFIKIIGKEQNVCSAENFFNQLTEVFTNSVYITTQEFKSALDMALNVKKDRDIANDVLKNRVYVPGRKRVIVPRTQGQYKYIEAIRNYDIVFAIGPAGTGKTYLAMAMAVKSLTEGKVNRIILIRPAVEAGEALGFLPGDMYEKVNPYLRPLYDALYDMMQVDRIRILKEKGVIEIAPLAYMRGRTLNDSFVILDEAQNTTQEQMKMFLTRLGLGSKAVVTGDITQIDLPNTRRSGLIHVSRLLKGINGLKFVYFNKTDIVRHKLVAKIINAYEKDKSQN